MIRYLLHLTFAAILLASCQKEKPAPVDQRITLGVKDSLFSPILSEERDIWVYVPGGSAPSSEKKYPVVYLLDGDAHFYSVVGMIHQLSSINGNTLYPEMIVVGIPNTDRTRDLTPTHVPVVFGDSTFAKTSGGAEKFTRFLQEELIPYIDSNYPTTSYRTLIGHSLGGLFAINALIHHPELFNNYLAIDPSLWWDEQKLVKQAEAALSANTFAGKSLFVAVANTMQKGMDLAEAPADTTETTEHIRSILQFSRQTEQRPNGLNFQWKYYPEDSHGSVPLIAEYDALRFMFSWYELKDLDDFLMPGSQATAQALTGYIQDHYQDVSDHFGYAVLPDENLVNQMGYALMQSQKIDHALALFSMNAENFPQSANTYDSLGDGYLAKGDTTQAIRQFEKAIALGDLPYSKEKLKALQEKE